MTNFLCKYGFHKFGAPWQEDEATYIVCQRCGDSKVIKFYDDEPEPDPLEVIEQSNIVAFPKRAA